jgi:hypothetical protein
MPEETISLREAAVRLARIRNPKGRKIESSRLLNVLRSGDLKAGFYFLHATEWVEIPAAYWQRIGSDSFRRIARSQSEARFGAYKVRANAFPDQVASIVCGKLAATAVASRAQSQTDEETAAEIIRDTAISYEVTIKRKEFDEYLTRHGQTEEQTISAVGRRRKEGWRELSSYMAAYFASHQRDRGTESVKIDQAKDDIIKAATEDRVPGLPAAETLKEQISKAKDLFENGKFKLKT